MHMFQLKVWLGFNSGEKPEFAIKYQGDPRRVGGWESERMNSV